MKPEISVVMPVYNGEKYLRLAIDSILDQSFKEFEFIIINDGSTDSTEQIIKSYDDPRIVYIKNEKNLGLSKSFNVGIKASRGQFIARMDADDISIKDRFEKQLSFLKNNSDLDITGSTVILIDSTGKRLKKIMRPLTHVDIKWKSLFSTPLIHPTVFSRAEIFRNNLYDESLTNSEDYELWSRLLFNTKTKFANIHEPLLYYRTAGFTQKLDKEKRNNSTRNSIRNMEHYVKLNEHEKNILTLLRQEINLSIRDQWSVLKLYKQVTETFWEKEKLGISCIFFTYPKLLGLSLFLTKYSLKHFSSCKSLT